jgi:hypothetical protein
MTIRETIIKLQHAIQHVAYRYDGTEDERDVEETLRILQAAMYDVVREHIGTDRLNELTVH